MRDLSIRFAVALVVALAGCSSSPHSDRKAKEEAPPINISASDRQFQTGVNLYQNRRYEQAARVFEAIVAERPYFTEAHLYLARCYHAMGRVDSAIPCYRSLLALSPGSVEGLTELSQVLMARGEAADAVQLLERACQRTGAREEVVLALAGAYEKAGQPDKGLDACLKHLQTHPACVPAACVAIQRLVERGQTKQAREIVEAALNAGVKAEQLPAVPAEGTIVTQPMPEPPADAGAKKEEPTPPPPAPPAPPTPTEAQVPQPATVQESGQQAGTPAPPPSPAPSKPTEEVPATKPEAPPTPPEHLSPEAQQWMEEGDRSIADGLAAEAIEAYKRSRANGGPEAMLSERMGKATRLEHEAEARAHELTAGIVQAKDPVGQRVQLATAFLQSGHYLEAQMLLVQVTVMAPEHGEAYYLLGLSYERRSQWQPASEAFRKAELLCKGTALEVQARFHLEELSAHLEQ